MANVAEVALLREYGEVKRLAYFLSAVCIKTRQYRLKDVISVVNREENRYHIPSSTHKNAVQIR